MGALLHVWPLVLIVAGFVWGHAGRRVERARFKWTMLRHGYRNHSQYVGGPEWKARRGRWLRDHRPRGCWCCGRKTRPWFPLHHLDYSRAGFGQELDRDLRCVCQPCHERFHRADRALRGVGVSLRVSTHLTRVCWLPVRVARRVLLGH